MAYGSVSLVRRYTGLSVSEVSNDEIISFLADAQELFLREIAVKDVKIALEQVSDTEFLLPHTPLADSDFDKNIGTDDIMLEAVNTETGATRDVEASELEPFKGYVKIPSKLGEREKLVATYFWYFSEDVYPDDATYDLFDRAVSILAGYLLIRRKFLFAPASITLGSLKVSRGLRDLSIEGKLLEEYDAILNSIRKRRSLS